MEGVGIRDAVIGGVRGNPDIADLDRCAVGEVLEAPVYFSEAMIEGSHNPHDILGQRSTVGGDTGRNFRDQPVVVRVSVSDEEGRDSPDVLGQARRFAFQFQADIEDDPCLGRLHFDAARTDFLVSSMYDDFHKIFESAGFTFQGALRSRNNDAGPCILLSSFCGLFLARFESLF